ncbi:replicative helicase loader/inhibitor [Bacillus mesophilum]|uniref:Replicative helicase inhibitor G39P N-terminal domain-containing protein n=1 Tax=Bacillus mesophilum TaxID=1071718 RepID=A0A7V7RNY8_9BACI|nr:replicative helicase loader/inhibitor [Bacillus mesophilum]KAB2334289.1 hypothetical protein F7732_09470 [Bacillus mesophilum]
MDRKQTAEVLQTIQVSYQGKFNVQDPARTLDAWEKALRKHAAEKIFANLDRHIETSVFPPTIADLVKEKPVDRMNAIPDVDETRRYLAQYDKELELTKEQEKHIENEKAKIRRILGIGEQHANSN